MAELVVVIVQGLVALIELSVHLVVLVLGALGFSVAHLAEKPAEGQSRFSITRLLIAFAPLAILVLLVGGGIALFQWRAEVRKARWEATCTLVGEQVKRLASQTDERGQFVKHPSSTLDVDDAWGNPLHVTYKESLALQTVEVRSVGYDEELGTWDDVSASHSLVRSKREIAKGAFERVKGAIKERFDQEE